MYANILFTVALIASCYAVQPIYYPSAAVPAYSYAIQPSAPLLKAAYSQGKAEEFEFVDPNPSYSFKYGVSDPHTGDQKSQEESLKDGVVHGAYSLSEPDGTVRTVTYTADKSSGFNAIVDRHSPKAAISAIPAVHAIQPIVHAAPAVAHAFQPIAPVYHSVPAAYKAAPLSYQSYPSYPSYATYH